MIRALHRWPGLLALALVTVLALSGAMLSVFPAAERLAAPQAAAGLTVAELAGAHPDRLSRRGADPARAVGPDHRLLVRRRRARRRRDRPGHGARRRLGRSEPDAPLADQPAPVALPGRCGPDRDGGGRGGDARSRPLRRGARRAAGRRLAALVRPPARPARRAAPCRDRPRRGRRARAVLGHRALDDRLDLRPPARWGSRALPSRRR